ncbi:NADP-dependent oxidoreductase [Nocardioides sp. TRM66260-LWL]|uniref:quinone oxidoreductase family protein n=1 Tax=Nocardioides sp. TRM66260-LWL TaxID=2874478 RepID=UPI001CC3674C|nr:NADP-dependent oxidoreductase [Nocardioides sp. TRM66260-LWL]MBZ5733320.1 NADP-dependent oxidoreductase [Nocardioides sp. TRM66260-LWL]
MSTDATSRTTRAVVATTYGGPEVLALTDVALPSPGPGEIEVAVRAAGVNPVDAKIRSGLFGPDPDALPRRLGSEAAGVVVAAGGDPETAAFTVGDEVVGFPLTGAYAERIVVPADALVRKPAEVSFVDAAGLLLVGATAEHALTVTKVGEGDTVLVHGGSGGVGLVAVQLAAQRGARVLATASEARHDLLRELGAEPLLYGDGLLERVRAAAPDGVDVALDLVGTAEALEVSLALVPVERITSIANFDSAPKAGVTVLGGGPGADPGTEIRAAARPRLLELLAAGSLRLVVSDVLPLEEVAEAHRRIDSGHTVGKIVLEV